MTETITELMSRLRLSSVMPFGALSAMATLVAMCGAGVAGALGLSSRRGRAVATAVAAVAAARLVLGVASSVLVQEELEPAVRAAELVGAWRDGAHELALRADHTFQLRGPRCEAGTWALVDQELSLGGTRARVIEVNGERRIVLSFPHDPDRWDGHLGFAREAR